MCGRTQQGSWSAVVDADTGSWTWLGPGNTNVPAGYYPPAPTPGTTPHPMPVQEPARAVASGACAGSVAGACTYGRFERSQGDPRGVIRTGYTGAR